MKSLAIVTAALAMLAIPLSASAAYEFYVQIEGVKQGKFKAEVTSKNWKDSVGGIDFSWEVVSPVDVATGRSSGKRQHKPIAITKEVGEASPQIFQALAQNEVLRNVLISFVETNAQGEEMVVYTIKLINATVTSQRTFLEAPQGGADVRLLETFTLSFQKIEIENKPGKTMATDDLTK